MVRFVMYATGFGNFVEALDVRQESQYGFAATRLWLDSVTSFFTPKFSN